MPYSRNFISRKAGKCLHQTFQSLILVSFLFLLLFITEDPKKIVFFTFSIFLAKEALL